MALILKDLLNALDKYGIEHDSESCIRRKLRKRSDVKTTASQFFLKPAVVSLDMDRKNCDPKSCVLIPRGDIPSEFFELLDGKIEGMVIYRCTYYSYVYNIDIVYSNFSTVLLD